LVAASAQAIAVSLPPPADLVAGTVTIPANATLGQNITITYQVSNDGANAANGTWYDSLYLSPTPTWSAGDPLLGCLQEKRYVAANGGSYT
jgi:subtilase family serine protease